MFSRAVKCSKNLLSRFYSTAQDHSYDGTEVISTRPTFTILIFSSQFVSLAVVMRSGRGCCEDWGSDPTSDTKAGLSWWIVLQPFYRRGWKRNTRERNRCIGWNHGAGYRSAYSFRSIWYCLMFSRQSWYPIPNTQSFKRCGCLGQSAGTMPDNVHLQLISVIGTKGSDRSKTIQA